MRSALRSLAGVAAALVLVAGAASVLVAPGRGASQGELSVQPRRGGRGARDGAPCSWCARVPAGRLLGGYSALLYVVLFAPIVVVVVYAFNANRIVLVWDGFSAAVVRPRAARRLDHLRDRALAGDRGRLGGGLDGVRDRGRARDVARAARRADAVRRARVPDARRARAGDRDLGADLLRQRRLRARAGDHVHRAHDLQRVARAAGRAGALRLDGLDARGGEHGPRRARPWRPSARSRCRGWRPRSWPAGCSRSRSRSTTW